MLNKKQRTAILKRDSYTCAICGSKKSIIVHHLDGNPKHNVDKNLLTVCKFCHAELHGLTLKFSKIRLPLIVELRMNRLTYKEIGSYLGISRQRVHQLIKSAKLSEYREELKILDKLPSPMPGEFYD